MSYQSYVCLARLGGSSCYFVWQTDVAAKQADRVLLDVDQCIATFSTEREARAAADARGEGAEPSAPVVYDLDRLAAWCEHPAEATLDCEAAINAWNLFNDLGTSTGGTVNMYRFAERGLNSVYDKLFFGNNLPSITPSGESYTPAWDVEELARLAQALRLGLTEFAARISPSSRQTERLP